MTSYDVMVDDNFHYMDEDERWKLGTFATADEAIAACKKLVDENLLSMLKNKPPGMTATELYELYVMFGDDPSVFEPSGVPQVEFSAWDYARVRAEELCEGSARIPPAGIDDGT